MAISNYEYWSRITRYIVLLCYFTLPVVFTLALLIVPTSTDTAHWVIWWLHMLPLLMFVIGLLKQNVRTYVWLCFVMLGYFLLAVQNVFARQTVLAMIEVALIVIMFIAAMLYVRWRSRALVLMETMES